MQLAVDFAGPAAFANEAAIRHQKSPLYLNRTLRLIRTSSRSIAALSDGQAIQNANYFLVLTISLNWLEFLTNTRYFVVFVVLNSSGSHGAQHTTFNPIELLYNDLRTWKLPIKLNDVLNSNLLSIQIFSLQNESAPGSLSVKSLNYLHESGGDDFADYFGYPTLDLSSKSKPSSNRTSSVFLGSSLIRFHPAMWKRYSDSRLFDDSLNSSSYCGGRHLLNNEFNETVAKFGIVTSCNMSILLQTSIKKSYGNFCPSRLLLNDDKEVVIFPVHGLSATLPSMSTKQPLNKTNFYFISESASIGDYSIFKEIRSAGECPFCNRQVYLTSQLISPHKSLLMHMCTWHSGNPGFDFEATTDADDNLHLTIRRLSRVSENSVSDGNKNFTVYRHHLDSIAESTTSMITFKEWDKVRSIKSIPPPVQFNPLTGETSTDYAQIDDWKVEAAMAEQLIREFSDVSNEEKDVMILWNRFMNSFRCFGDCQMPEAVTVFVRRFGHVINQNHLRHNFLLHLVTLWDFGLVGPNDISSCMHELDVCD